MHYFKEKLIDRFINCIENIVSSPLLVMINHETGVHTFTNGNLPFTILLYENRVSFRKHTNDTSIHIDTYLLESQFEKVINRIKVLAGYAYKIHGRKTTVRRVSRATAFQFQNENHLLDALPGRYSYGLFYKEDLVSVAVFSNGRNMKKIKEGYRSYELLRFCHKKDLLVVGGISKIIKQFEKDFSPDDIMTYVDLDWTSQSKLDKINFMRVSKVAPQKYWIYENKRYLLQSFETEDLYKKECPNGFIKYNSGSLKMILKLGI